ncbi:MAG TPA: glycosyl hydrolase 115 family protein [Opitutaceae bacterium]|nr:glycosyl hydrolase 115 family protein [Opitutaceae bacterium]
MKSTRALCGLVAAMALAPCSKAALGERSLVEFTPISGGFPLADQGRLAPILVDSKDWPGVVRVAADLQADEERVCGTKPALKNEITQASVLVVIGTLGKSAFVDRLASEGRIDVSKVRGGWESWATQVVEHPFPGVERALVIAGSDKRGTIYGTYNLSEEIGVSPWYWWSDVAVTPHDRIFVSAEPDIHGPPVVKYRGIFLNDEAPDLSNWVRAKFGSVPVGSKPPIPEGVANYGREFYSRIFEVLLRLRGNYLWPAMWNNAFNEDDQGNAALADEYGVVMGTSHQEPMLRAQKEWDRRYGATLGYWNYSRDAELLQSFWREGVRRNKGFESVYTLGLRGANDTEMAPGGPSANRAMLEGIVSTQRDLLRQEVNSDLTQVPQMWCLYKEVQEYYESGMRTPDDVTLLWADDNWGNLRRVPDLKERGRSGGAGIYYHFDYVGEPRNYKWVDTNSLAKTWDQLSLAAAYGADRLWIVNVGHFKGYERPTEFFLKMAWAPSRWGPNAADEFTGLWAKREFGPENAPEIAKVVSRLTILNSRRKPEMLSPGTYSLINYREANSLVAEFASLAAEANRIQGRLPASKRDAFYETVAFPAKATSIVNALYVTAATNALYASQGRAGAANQAAQARNLFQQDKELMASYNTGLEGGRWDHFMDQTHIGYTIWNDPKSNTLAPLGLVDPPVQAGAKLGVAAEGSSEAWPGGEGQATLPRFDSVNRQNQTIEVFARGDAAFAYTLTASQPWILMSSAKGTADATNHLHFIWIDWSAAPPGSSTATVRVSGAGESVDVTVDILNATKGAAPKGFAENQGVVSIEAEHFSGSSAQGNSRWTRIANYGRTLSGMRAEAPPYSAAAVPGADAARLDYDFCLLEDGAATIEAIIGPTLNFQPGKPLRYAVAVDDEAPQVITAVPAGFNMKANHQEWQTMAGDNAHVIRTPHGPLAAGNHTLRIWVVDPGVVVEKLLIDAGGLKPSYLGPPESRRLAGAK